MSLPAKKLGPYELVSEVGAGGLGRVFKAVDHRTGSLVAIKMLHDQFANSRRFLGIFHRELLIISGLHHKNIVRYLDGQYEPPRCYIVTEFVDGFSLHALIKKTGPMPPVVALSILFNLLQGVDYLHLHDIVHADLSAANVLIDLHGRVLLTDFGLACQSEVEGYRNFMVGTPGYYSPEHISEAPVCPQTDLYCAGLLLFEMLTGRKLIPPDQDRRKLLAQMKAPRYEGLKFSELRIAFGIKKILKNSLQFSVSRRYANAEEMLYAIYGLLSRYRIRYARNAIHQFFCETGLAPKMQIPEKQDIYRGWGRR